MTGGIAHDFNNMLTGIIGSLELLRRRVSRGKLDDLDSLIDLGVTSANRAAGLTHRLLAFSRRQSLDSKPVEINQLVTAMGELLQRSINESIALDMRLTDAPWTAEADPNQLESALLNLVINARDAMPNGGNLTVETSNRHLNSVFTSAMPTAPASCPVTNVLRNPSLASERSASQMPNVHTRVAGKNANPACNTL